MVFIVFATFPISSVPLPGEDLDASVCTGNTLGGAVAAGEVHRMPRIVSLLNLLAVAPLNAKPPGGTPGKTITDFLMLRQAVSARCLCS